MSANLSIVRCVVVGTFVGFSLKGMEMKGIKLSGEARAKAPWLAASKWLALGVSLFALVPSTSHAGLAYTEATCLDQGIAYRCRGTFAGFRARTGAGATDYAIFSSLKVTNNPVEFVFVVQYDGAVMRCSVPTSVPSSMLTAMLTGSASGSNRWFEVKWNKESGSCERIWIESGSPY